MTTKPIPPAANLEYYRKQAKTLHKSVLSSDTDSIARIQGQLPKFALGDRFLLSDAQWVVAREHGLASWAKFKQFVENEARPKEKPMPATTTAPKGGGISSKSVKAATGISLEEWFEILDGAGCARMTHKEIVAVCHEHGAGSWWQQMVTVQYEQARGLRVLNQSCDGEFRVNSTRTIAAPVVSVFNAWNDPAQREDWLPKSGMTIRKATSPKSLRITWGDGTNVDVNLVSKGEAKSVCAVEHGKLSGTEEVEERRAYWTAAMERLKSMLER